MISIHKDLSRRLLFALCYVVLLQWVLFILYHIVEYIYKPAHLIDELEEISILFAILCVGLPLMVYLTVRISRKVLEPLQDITTRAAALDPGETTLLEQEDRYTEIRTLRSAINQALLQYSGSLEQARRFGGDASHQLRTPLAVVRSGCEVALSRTRKPEDYQQVLMDVLEETSRLENIVRQLQLLARLDRGETDLKEPLEVSELLSRLKERAEPLAENQNIRLNIDSEQDAVLKVNATLLEEALFNLIENGIYAASESGRVGVRVRRKDDKIRFEIEDDGSGISQAHTERIFERFYRGQEDAYDGSGLGLPIARAIAELHGGTLALDPDRENTCFILTLPRPTLPHQSHPLQI